MPTLSGNITGCDDEVVHIAVVDAPSHELLDALHFATTRHIDIVCWTSQQMEGLTAYTGQKMLPWPVASQKAAPAHETAESDVSIPLWRNGLLIFILSQPENHYRIRLRVDGVLHALPVTTEMALPSSQGWVLGSLDNKLSTASHKTDNLLLRFQENLSLVSHQPLLPRRYGEKPLRLLHQVEVTGDAALGM